ncbi:MupA/Atu3671 family FMN-dependent luciferase-like monooxygenase [Vibrio vulnificus]
MSDLLKEKLSTLSPEQRELLRKRASQKKRDSADDSFAMDFSLFFFSASGEECSSNKYDMLLQCAELADRGGIKAIWLPERHFTHFGGLYPNPSVLAAAVAMKTRNIELRAGSVVVPLHNPIRIVEEWSVVDNLSNGRVSLGLASGWNKEDFALRPEAWHDRRQRVAEGMEQMQRLWQGEVIEVNGVDNEKEVVQTFPRPIQDKLNYWLTCSSEDGWKIAGEKGCNVLCMLGNSINLLAQNIENYRQARTAAGFDPNGGTVTVMLHTYIDDDLVRAKEEVRQPMMQYLTGYIKQFDNLVNEQTRDNVNENKQQLLDFAFERYFEQAALFGPKSKCKELIAELNRIGVNEIACLVDFGVPLENTLSSLTNLTELAAMYPSSNSKANSND